MRPDDRDLDEELRGHLALSVQQHIERGADPEAARRAALRELGYVGDVRESMRRVWCSRWYDAAAALARDMRLALRSLRRAKGLAATIVVTLALGIGANAAVFSVVRSVLLRPLVNRGEDRLVYIRQSAPGLGEANTTFSVPEVRDLEAHVKTIASFGDFSTGEFTLIGLGQEPRMISAGVVSGSYFDVMGLRPVLGRLLDSRDDGPNAAGAAVLTYRFWQTSLKRDPSVIGRTIRLGPRTCSAVSSRYRDHRQHRRQSASPRRADAHESYASHDGAVRPPRPRSLHRAGAPGADIRTRSDDAGASRGV